MRAGFRFDRRGFDQTKRTARSNHRSCGFCGRGFFFNYRRARRTNRPFARQSPSGPKESCWEVSAIEAERSSPSSPSSPSVLFELGFFVPGGSTGDEGDDRDDLWRPQSLLRCHATLSTTEIHNRTAEADREGFGEVFPGLPDVLLGPETVSARFRVSDRPTTRDRLFSTGPGSGRRGPRDI